MRAKILLVLALVAGTAQAQSLDERPWELADPVLVIDPYEANSLDWEKVATDRAVKGVLHRAYFGTREDTKARSRIAEAKRRGYSAGIYLLGRRGDPIRQADLLVAMGQELGVTLLALDIEDMSSVSMSLPDAERFIERVHAKTGHYPMFYTNFSTYRYISDHYDQNSAFAKTPLWLARFGPRHGMDRTTVWGSYTLWQFQSEINCRSGQTCYHRVPGTTSDMDVNVFRGSASELAALFGTSR
jgi:GH25 family lysozyme M1 (1,4-beta-N-acetylmuramidase)